jgi:hypothetical protein
MRRLRIGLGLRFAGRGRGLDGTTSQSSRSGGLSLELAVVRTDVAVFSYLGETAASQGLLLRTGWKRNRPQGRRGRGDVELLLVRTGWRRNRPQGRRGRKGRTGQRVVGVAGAVLWSGGFLRHIVAPAPWLHASLRPQRPRGSLWSGGFLRHIVAPAPLANRGQSVQTTPNLSLKTRIRQRARKRAWSTASFSGSLRLPTNDRRGPSRILLLWVFVGKTGDDP